ncbi:MAG TPA: hypothetical protein VHL11_17460, partial [Phototrophicaceae bacterium]|nr:hypothetical protein [Phototrophicaceae bacterium]
MSIVKQQIYGFLSGLIIFSQVATPIYHIRLFNQALSLDQTDAVEQGSPAGIKSDASDFTPTGDTYAGDAVPSANTVSTEAPAGIAPVDEPVFLSDGRILGRTFDIQSSSPHWEFITPQPVSPDTLTSIADFTLDPEYVDTTAWLLAND